MPCAEKAFGNKMARAARDHWANAAACQMGLMRADTARCSHRIPAEILRRRCIIGAGCSVAGRAIFRHAGRIMARETRDAACSTGVLRAVALATRTDIKSVHLNILAVKASRQGIFPSARVDVERSVVDAW